MSMETTSKISHLHLPMRFIEKDCLSWQDVEHLKWMSYFLCRIIGCHRKLQYLVSELESSSEEILLGYLSCQCFKLEHEFKNTKFVLLDLDVPISDIHLAAPSGGVVRIFFSEKRSIYILLSHERRKRRAALVLKATCGQDWTTTHWSVWDEKLKKLALEAKRPKILEIGSWEGLSASWFLQNIRRDDVDLVCVDHFDSMRTQAGRKRRDYFNFNMRLAGNHDKVQVIPQFSLEAMSNLVLDSTDRSFDFIYIDASHRSKDVLEDAILSWKLLNMNCYLLFDDYLLNENGSSSLESIEVPKRGIDTFLNLYADELEVLHQDYQVLVRKKSRLFKNVPISSKMNIVYVFDESYAFCAGASIESLLHNCSNLENLHIYLVCFGIQLETRQKLDTFKIEKTFIDVDDSRLLKIIGAAGIMLSEKAFQGEIASKKAQILKLFLREILPTDIRKILYLDCDVVIRSDIQVLWNMVSETCVLAAVLDYGFPYGTEEITEKLNGQSYFNSGVFFQNLRFQQKIDQQHFDRLMRGKFHFWDQEMLNLMYRNKWVQLPLEWNAHGHGSYLNQFQTKYPLSETLLRRIRDEPCIVHYTGSCRLPLASPSDIMKLPLKPWVPLCSNPWKKEFFRYLESSPFKSSIHELTMLRSLQTKYLNSQFNQLVEMIENE